MKIKVTEFEKNYTFFLAPVTQFCGQNIMKKTYIFESIRRYFSTYKYGEGKSKWRNNVQINDANVGRHFFAVVSVQNSSDLLSMINWSKQSLMVEYIKGMMQRFEWQMHFQTINEEVDAIYQIMNDEISHLGNIELSYAVANVWDMVQKTEVISGNQEKLEDKSNFELLIIFLNLLEKINKLNPKKILVLIENVDHMVSQQEYVQVMHRLQSMGMNNDMHFILSTSLQGYVMCDEELCSGIMVFNDVDFQMPELEHILTYLEDNYPCYKILLLEQLKKELEKVVHKIGSDSYLSNPEEQVISKLINQSLMKCEKWEKEENNLEIAFLKS